ncbi:MAG: DUF2145 domain-containing protein [Burkholderiaceae bacterium]
MSRLRAATRMILVIVTLSVAWIDGAVAGRTCEPYVLTPATVARGLELGKRSFDLLEASGAEVALIARAGQDLTRYGLRYSHMGFVWCDHPDGRWTVVHELNACGSAESSLFDQGLGNFFLDDPFRYEALIVIPDVESQHRLATMLAGDMPQRMHEPHYNVIAFPFSTRYQNSNQWALELMATAMSRDFPIADRASAQTWLKAAGYRPTTLEIPALTRLGGRLFKANVAFDDHPFDRRMAGRIDAVSVESVLDFLRARAVVEDEQVVSMPVTALPGRPQRPGRADREAPIAAAPPPGR